MIQKRKLKLIIVKLYCQLDWYKDDYKLIIHNLLYLNIVDYNINVDGPD